MSHIDINNFATASFAEAYQKFRPTFPREVPEKIIAFMDAKKTGPYTLAVDIGCGNGHSTTHFAQYFEHIIGFDASQEQVKAANDSNEFSNIQYKFGRAENIPIESQTVDLVSVANCAHWFENIDIFYKEVERVLKPGGCLAIYGYGDLKLHHETKSEALQAIYDEFRYVTLKEHWFEGHKHVKRNPYEFYNPPFAEIETYGYITMERLNTTTVSDFIGLLRSFSAYNRYVHVHPEKQDLLQKIEAMIMQVLDLESPPEKTSLEFNYQHVFLITARKK